jgi:hypothetical protein
MRENALVAASVSGPAPAGSGSSSKMSRLNNGCIEEKKSKKERGLLCLNVRRRRMC